MVRQIHIPNEASVHLFRHFLSQNEFFPTEAESFNLNFHPRFVYLQPFALAMLAAWAAHWRAKRTAVDCKNLAPAGIDYAWRMGLFEHLDTDYRPERAEHEEAGRFIPLRKLTSGEDLAGFLNDVAPLLHRPEHIQAVQYCLSETIRNVLEHAGGASAYACAQFYQEARRVSIGVADCGVGVLASLRRSHGMSTHSDALIAALTPGITGALSGMYGPPDNAGVGLFFTKSIAKASHQYFGIYSGDAAFRLRRVSQREQFLLYSNPQWDRHDLYTNLPFWNGTVVAVDIGMREIRSFEATMAAIRDAITPQRPGDRKLKVKFS
jgi:hypothetical protein